MNFLDRGLSRVHDSRIRRAVGLNCVDSGQVEVGETPDSSILFTPFITTIFFVGPPQLGRGAPTTMSHHQALRLRHETKAPDRRRRMNAIRWLLVVFLTVTSRANADPSASVGDATSSWCAAAAVVGTPRGGGSGSASSSRSILANDARPSRTADTHLECLEGNGGGWEWAQTKLQSYLDGFANAKQRQGSGEFLIQGWRWHTLALAREAHRLHVLGRQLSSRISNQNATDDDSVMASGIPVDVESLRKAADYVVGFNMKGLHRIERDVFFPWVRKHVVEPMSHQDVDASRAVSTVLDRLESQQRAVESLGRSLNQAAARASDTQPSMLEEVSNVAAEIAQCAKSMIQTEDTLLVPTIASFVPSKEQRQLNDRVIRSLGVWDSRLHLVGMYEAVWETNDEREKQLFRMSIPSIPQRMIPRWKRLLYEPRAGALSRVG